MNERFTGVFIPSSLWEDDSLKLPERVLLVEVHALDKGKGAWASNAHYEKLLSSTQTTITRHIKTLVDRGYVRVEEIESRRHIFLTLKWARLFTPCLPETEEGGSQNDYGSEGGVVKMTRGGSQNDYQDIHIDSSSKEEPRVEDESSPASQPPDCSESIKKKEEKKLEAERKRKLNNEAIFFYKGLINNLGLVYSPTDERKFATSLYSQEIKTTAAEFGYESVRPFVSDIVRFASKDKWLVGKVCGIPGFAREWRKIASRMVAEGELKRGKKSGESEAILQALRKARWEN